MTGLSNATSTLHQVLWADAELGRLEVDYDDLCLVVRESTGTMKRVICEGYLGFELAGFWDEVVIMSAEVVAGGPFLDRCLSSLDRRLGHSPLASGSEARNRERAMQLVLTLDDGCQLNVAMKGLWVEGANDRKSRL